MQVREPLPPVSYSSLYLTIRQTVPEFKSLIISPVHPTHSNFNRLSETVTSCIWRTHTSPPKRAAAFLKRLCFPGKDDTSGDEEWELWRKRNLEVPRHFFSQKGAGCLTYTLYRLFGLGSMLHVELTPRTC